MIFWQNDTTIEALQKVLKQDQVILASGDTVLGLWATLTEQSFCALNKIKIRNDKPYLITIPDTSKLEKFIDQPITERLKTLIETCWPGPVTLIFKARKDLPSWMVSAQGTIALRVPDHAGLLQVMSEFDGLFSTSANIHGAPIPNCLDYIDPIVLSRVGMVCVQQGQTCYPIYPSTILDCSFQKIEIVRSGAYPVDDLKNLII